MRVSIAGLILAVSCTTSAWADPEPPKAPPMYTPPAGFPLGTQQGDPQNPIYGIGVMAGVATHCGMKAPDVLDLMNKVSALVNTGKTVADEQMLNRGIFDGVNQAIQDENTCKEKMPVLEALRQSLPTPPGSVPYTAANPPKVPGAKPNDSGAKPDGAGAKPDGAGANPDEAPLPVAPGASTDPAAPGSVLPPAAPRTPEPVTP